MSKESTWKNPTAVVAVGGLLLSLAGNWQQYRNASQQLELSEQRWTLEKGKLQFDLDSLEARRKLDEERWALEKSKLQTDQAKAEAERKQLEKNNRLFDEQQIAIRARATEIRRELSQIEFQIRQLDAARDRAARQMALQERQAVSTPYVKAQLAALTASYNDYVKLVSDQKTSLERRRAELELQLKP